MHRFDSAYTQRTQNLIIFLEIPLDIIPDFVFWLVNPEVALAKDVGVEGEEQSERIFIVPAVGVKACIERAVNVLAEEDFQPLGVRQIHHRTG